MTYEEVLEAIKTRDYNDMHKPVGALKIAEDAIVIDTTHLTIGQVKGKVKDIIFDKNNNIYNNKAEMLRRLYVACSRTRHKLYICYGKAE